MNTKTLLLAGCGMLSASLAHAQETTVFLSGKNLDSLGYHSGILFWQAGCSRSGVNSASIIERTPAGDNAAVTTYFDQATCAGPGVRSTTVAMDGGRNVYWATQDGRIVTLAADASPADTPVTLANMADPNALLACVSASANFVYWAETTGDVSFTGDLYRVPVSGGARETIFENGDGVAALHAIGRIPGFPPALGETIIYKQSGGAMVSATRAPVLPGQDPWTATTLANRIDSFKVVGSRIYYAWPDPLVGSKRISSLSTRGTGATNHALLEAAGDPFVSDITADGSAVYWYEKRSTGGPIRRAMLGGGPPDTITGVIELSAADRLYLESDGGALYWRNSRTEIHTLPVDARAIEYVFSAGKIEVVQAIQGNSHFIGVVPLVADKTTWVRSLGSFQTADLDVTQLDNQSLVQLHGDRGGVPLPGSPLNPTIHRPLRTTGGVAVDRTDPSVGSWFKLPLEWTTGDVSLRAVFNGQQIFPQTSSSVNEAQADVTFIPREPIVLYVYPLRTHQGTIRSYDPAYQPVFDMAEALLPTPELRVDFRGGTTIKEWEPEILNPFNYGPYELSEADNDSGKVFYKLNNRLTHSGNPTDAVIEHMAFFKPFRYQANAGSAYINIRMLLCSMDLGVTTDTPINPYGALALAHEIGHTFGRAHVACGDPMPEDPGFYPYDPCTIAGDTSIRYQGWNPISRQLILGDDTADIMSYAYRRWTSDYTWLEIFAHLAPIPAALPPPRGTPRGAAGQPLLLGGIVTANGVAELQPAIPLPDASSQLAAAELVADLDDHTTWQIVVRRSDGTLLATIQAGASTACEGGPVLVYATMEEMPDAATLELQRTDFPGIAQATLTGGGQAPTVAITSPTAGEVVGGALFLRWDAADPEGAPLLFQVRHSNDHGATWQLIADEVRENLLVLDATRLPGGAANQSQIEVMASDGLRTATAKSAFFTIPAKAPEPLIFIETDRGRSCGETPLIAAGETVALRGRANDLEDGIIPETSLAWTVDGATGFTRMGTGRELFLRDLPPGAYAVELEATDSDNQTSIATANFGVRPFAISEATTSPLVDGYGDDDAYLACRHPLHIRYPSGTPGTVRAVLSGTTVYVSMTGMLTGAADPGDFANLSFDSNNSDDANAQSADIRFVATRDGEFYSARGDGLGGFDSDRSTNGFTARVVGNAERWHAEFAIPLSAIGAAAGQVIGMDAGHFWREAMGDDYHWLSVGTSSWNRPSDWSDVLLASDPDDPADIDADGLYDVWEIANFGSTTGDGSQDTDGDGQLDGAEFQSGTDPNSPGSRFVIDSIVSEDGFLRIDWMSVTDHVYTVETSSDLEVWQVVRADLQGTGLTMSYSIDPSLSEQRIFARVTAHVCPQF